MEQFRMPEQSEILRVIKEVRPGIDQHDSSIFGKHGALRLGDLATEVCTRLNDGSHEMHMAVYEVLKSIREGKLRP